MLIVFMPVAYTKTSLMRTLKKKTKIVFQDHFLLNVGQKYCRVLEGEHFAIFSTFIQLLFVIKIFVLSIFEWPVLLNIQMHCRLRLTIEAKTKEAV